MEKQTYKTSPAQTGNASILLESVTPEYVQINSDFNIIRKAVFQIAILDI